MNIQKFKKTFFMTVIAALMAAATVLLALPILRVCRKNSSFIMFWIFQIIVIGLFWSVGFSSIAITYGSLSLLVGTYYELEKRGINIFISGLLAITLSGGFSVGTTSFILSKSGTNISEVMKKQVDSFIAESSKINSTIKLNADTLLAQAPSALVCFLIIALAISLIFEGPTIRLFKVEDSLEKKISPSLTAFKVPDFLIWIAMISFLFSFLDIGNSMVMNIAANIVNVLAILYFFQGIAVIESFFTVFKFGFLVRFLTYVVFLIQLFLLVTAVGVIDYWVEFRNRFIKKKPVKV